MRPSASADGHEDGDHPIDVPALQPHHDGREEESEEDGDRQGHEQVLRQAQDGHYHRSP